MTLKFTGGEHLQRGRGLGGLLRLVKSVFSPIARTVVKAAKSNTGKSILNALKQQAIESSVNLATDALRGNDMSKSFQGEMDHIRENAANSLEHLRRGKKRPKNKNQRGKGLEPSSKRHRKNKKELRNKPKRDKRTSKGLFD